MSKIISGTNIGLTDALKEHIHKNIEKFEQLDTKITNVRVTLKKDVNNFIAEIVVNSGLYKDELVATGSTYDMYESINLATKKMVVRLKKINQKVKVNPHHEKAA